MADETWVDALRHVGPGSPARPARADLQSGRVSGRNSSTRHLARAANHHLFHFIKDTTPQYPWERPAALGEARQLPACSEAAGGAACHIRRILARRDTATSLVAHRRKARRITPDVRRTRTRAAAPSVRAIQEASPIARNLQLRPTSTMWRDHVKL